MPQSEAKPPVHRSGTLKHPVCVKLPTEMATKSDLIHVSAPAELTGKTCRVPGSKSEANRALIAELLAPSTGLGVTQLPDSEDITILSGLFRQLGFNVQEVEGKGLCVKANRAIPGKALTIDCKQSGTALRFLTAACTVLPGTWTLTGTPRLAERPLKPLIDALREAGARIQADVLPLTIVGNPDWQPKRLVLREAPTSQFASALLLMGWVLPIGTELDLPAHRPSRAYEQHTHAFLLAEGVKWTPTETGYRLTSRAEWPPDERRIAGDWSAASYLLVPALFRRGQYTIAGLQKGTLQADECQLEWLAGRVDSFEFTTEGLRLSSIGVYEQPGFELDCSNNPDLAQTYAVAALGCRGTSLLTGLGTLPLKETDRLAALVTELQKTGAQVAHGPDWLRITPPERWPAAPLTFNTYDDHRMAMAFALVSLFHVPGVFIHHPQVVTKSFPDYWVQLANLSFQVNPATAPPNDTSPQ